MENSGDLKFKRGEVWRAVFHGLYEVSKLGSIRRVGAKKKLRAVLNNKGYLMVGLWKDGERRLGRVHRLVAEQFIDNPNPNKYKLVNHKDSNRTNNRWDNLEWTDYVGNERHAILSGRKPNIISAQLAKEIKDKAKSGVTFRNLLLQYPNVGYFVIWHIQAGKTWKWL